MTCGPASVRIITGERGAGKTTFCRRMAELARLSGWDAAGILSPARIGGEGKTGIWAEDVRSGQRRLLASSTAGEVSGSSLCRWAFDEDALQWADRMLASSIPCDLLIVDEIGPLELERAAGLRSWRAVLGSGAFRAALAVVRPECAGLFSKEWPDAPGVVVTSAGAAELQAELLFRRLSAPSSP
jgi:nucleoside-triphosphatase